jgi:nicotinate-nucleotide--dimethylbenzimidazole phosphoribosyltransferase
MCVVNLAGHFFVPLPSCKLAELVFLGRLEDVAARLCAVQQTLAPRTTPRRVVLFAADHGVVAEGVTAWSAEVTRLMVQAIVSGGAASSVLAAATGTDLRVIDVGVAGPGLPDAPVHLCRKVRAGSRNLAQEPALTVEEFRRAVAVGEEQAAGAWSDGMAVVAAGEMGIGNSTPASCLTALLSLQRYFRRRQSRSRVSRMPRA